MRSKGWQVRLGKPKAIVAIARKLLLVVWHVLTKRVADREAIAEKVAGKFLEWSWKLGHVNRAGLDSGTFIRRELRSLRAEFRPPIRVAAP